MKTEFTQSSDRQWLRSLMERVLPRNVRDEYRDALDEYSRKPLAEQLTESGGLVANGYLTQAVAGFKRYAFLAEIVLVTFCLVAAAPSGVPLKILFAEGAVLAALSLRDIWAYQVFDRRAKVPPGSCYYRDSINDALCASVFLFFAEGFAQCISPGIALPASVVYRSAVIFLPVVSTLRMVLRPRPDPEPPASWQGLSAIDIFKRAWWLNILWVLTYSFTIMVNTSSIPGHIPDMLRGFLPNATFAMFIAIRRDGLGRRNKIETILLRWEKLHLSRLKETLAQGADKNDPCYWSCKGAEVMIFATLAISVGDVIWSWLSGHDAHAGFFIVIVNMLGFAATLLSWKYVKQCNRAAAQAIQAEIDEDQQ